jgi:hypothetical protein
MTGFFAESEAIEVTRPKCDWLAKQILWEILDKREDAPGIISASRALRTSITDWLNPTAARKLLRKTGFESLNVRMCMRSVRTGTGQLPTILAQYVRD